MTVRLNGLEVLDGTTRHDDGVFGVSERRWRRMSLEMADVLVVLAEHHVTHRDMKVGAEAMCC